MRRLRRRRLLAVEGAAAASGDIIDQLFTPSNGAAWVAGEREVSGALTDLIGGGRHMLKPGGTADPVDLDHDGTDYFWFPGTSLNRLTCPMPTVTDLHVEIQARDILQGYDFLGLAGARVQHVADGTLRFTIGGVYDWISTTAWTPASGFSWLRIKLDVDNGSGQSVVTFDESTDDRASWDPIGGAVVFGSTTSLNTSSISIGAGASWGRGDFARVVVRSGLDGAVERDIRASDADPNATTFTEASSNAATVTINRSASGYVTEVVDQPLCALATDDYIYTADDGIFDADSGESMTAIVVGRLHDNSSYQVLMSKRSGGVSVGWMLGLTGAAKLSAEIDDGTEISADNLLGLDWDDTPPNHGQYAFTFLRDDASSEIGAFVAGGATDPDPDTTGDLSNSEELRIGAVAGGSLFANITVAGACTIKQALTAQQISDVADALITRNGGTP